MLNLFSAARSLLRSKLACIGTEVPDSKSEPSPSADSNGGIKNPAYDQYLIEFEWTHPLYSPKHLCDPHTPLKTWKTSGPGFRYPEKSRGTVTLSVRPNVSNDENFRRRAAPSSTNFVASKPETQDTTRRLNCSAAKVAGYAKVDELVSNDGTANREKRFKLRRGPKTTTRQPW